MAAALNEQDQKRLVELLKRLEPGFLPYEIFEQIARLVVLPIIEFIPLRLNKDGEIEVLLIKRDETDKFWPGMLHTPGTVIRATDQRDKSYEAYNRILHDELEDTPTGQPYYFGSMLHESKRGMEQAQLFWVEVTGQPKVGEFYAVNDLPGGLIASQRDFINQAAKSFGQYRQLA